MAGPDKRRLRNFIATTMTPLRCYESRLDDEVLTNSRQRRKNTNHISVYSRESDLAAAGQKKSLAIVRPSCFINALVKKEQYHPKKEYLYGKNF